jgi:hypothetical protein
MAWTPASRERAALNARDTLRCQIEPNTMIALGMMAKLAGHRNAQQYGAALIEKHVREFLDRIVHDEPREKPTDQSENAQGCEFHDRSLIACRDPR